MTIKPFSVLIPKAMVEDLRQRLSHTRFPNELVTTGWEAGVELQFVQQLAQHWQNNFDWQAFEQKLNRHMHFLQESSDGANGRELPLHFIHERAKNEQAEPIVLLHGWSDSFFKFHYLIDYLTGKNGGLTSDQRTFHVVVPSLPGFGFSGQPGPGEMSPETAARSIAGLMEELGYSRYYVHGGDWGSAVAQAMGQQSPDTLLGIHLTDVPFSNLFTLNPDEVDPEEKTFLDALYAWGEREAGYVSIQSTRPLTLAYALSDSPIGLAAWIIDHFKRYSQTMPSMDDLIANVMIYWLSNTIRSSIRYYHEGVSTEWETASDGDFGSEEIESSAGGLHEKINVPTAIAVCPFDIGQPPRQLAERFFNIVQFSQLPGGGHYAALEEPALMADSICSFAQVAENVQQYLKADSF